MYVLPKIYDNMSSLRKPWYFQKCKICIRCRNNFSWSSLWWNGTNYEKKTSSTFTQGNIVLLSLWTHFCIGAINIIHFSCTYTNVQYYAHTDWSCRWRSRMHAWFQVSLKTFATALAIPQYHKWIKSFILRTRIPNQFFWLASESLSSRPTVHLVLTWAFTERSIASGFSLIDQFYVRWKANRISLESLNLMVSKLLWQCPTFLFWSTWASGCTIIVGIEILTNNILFHVLH